MAKGPGRVDSCRADANPQQEYQREPGPFVGML